MLTTILAFAAVLLALVLVHEWGHFYAARKMGMEVDEFGFGFPPRMFSIKKGETRYSFNWLPLGGFVKIKGENGEDTSEGSFASKSLPARLLVLSAGVIMNMVLAWVLLSVAFTIGTPQAVGIEGNGGKSANHRVMIAAVAPDSPAESAGIKPGDVILKINSQSIGVLEQVQEYTSANAGIEITYSLSRDGQIIDLKLTPRENPPPGQGAIGVQLVEVADIAYPWYESIWRGLVATWNYFKFTILSFTQLLGQLFTGQEVTGDVAGPVGIAKMTGQFARMGIAALLQFAALLSINLAIINALPIPALDGGRIVFLGVEALRGRKVRAKVEQWSHAVGFVLLLALMIFITVRDIVNHF